MLKAALLALALSAAAASAHAAPALFDAYEGFCVKTDGDAAGGLAAATSAGWSEMPAAMLQQVATSGGIDSPQGRMHSSAAGFDFLIEGVKKMPIGPMTLDVHFCAVASTAAGPPSELAAALAKWAGIPANPLMSKNGLTGYAFLNEGGAHKPIASPGDAEQAKALLQSGHFRIALVQESNPSMLAYAVPTL